MSHNLTDKQEVSYWIWLPLLFILGVLTLMVPPTWIKDWDNYQFIIFSAVPVLYFGLSLLGIFKMPIRIIKSDIAWLVFIGIGFLSYLWATNGSLIWYQAFGWLTLFFWLLLFRAIPTQEKGKDYVQGFFIVLFFVLTLPVIWHLFEGRINWRGDFGYHRNYVGSYLLSMYPFLLFASFKTPLFRITQILGTIIIFYILSHTNSRGAIIALCVICFYYLWNTNWNNKLKKSLLLGGGIGMLSILAVGLLMPSSFRGVQLLNEFNGANELDRWYMVRNSIWLFLEHPLTGIGFGNWKLEAYKYGVSEFSDLNAPSNFARYGNHNLYSQHLAELGLIGFLAFFAAIGSALWYGLRFSKHLSSLQKAAYSSLLIYLITSFFYQSPNFFQYYFSGLQLLAFISLGILTSNDSTYNKTLGGYGKIILCLLSIACLTWFVYAKKTHDLYLKAAAKVWTDKQKTIIEIEHLYHPVFKRTHGTSLSLDYKLAYLYASQRSYEKTIFYYEHALEVAPYDENILLAYGRFLSNIKKEFSQAKAVVLKAYAIQKNSYATNLLLAQIAFKETNYEEAREYLKAFDKLIERIYNSSSIRNRNKGQLQRLKLKESDALTNKDKSINNLLIVKLDSLAEAANILQKEELSKYKANNKTQRSYLLQVNLLQAQIATHYKEWKVASDYWEKALVNSDRPSF